jgi:hypothetical protein
MNKEETSMIEELFKIVNNLDGQQPTSDQLERIKYLNKKLTDVGIKSHPPIEQLFNL